MFLLLKNVEPHEVVDFLYDGCDVGINLTSAALQGIVNCQIGNKFSTRERTIQAKHKKVVYQDNRYKEPADGTGSETRLQRCTNA